MTDSNDDKTRIPKPENNQANNDRTRIAPAKKNATDKTRIAPSKQSNSNSDKTRIAPTKKINPATDKTRIAPSRKPAVKSDATQFKPASPGSKQARQPAVSQENTTPQYNSAHTILKDRFVLEKVLGAGGMGVVYKTKDLLKVEAKDRDPYIAIKVLSDEFKSHPEAFISLQRESRKSQRIAHPNIVNVFDFDKDGDTVFMTMEYMDGQPLDQLIRQYKSTGLPTDDAWEITKGICAALVHAHSENIVHSDFKPGNIFVTNRGMAKVFDFGIARAVAKVDHHGDIKEDKTLFDAGNLGALTPAYASLEMLEGQVPDVRDDIYALGCVVYEIFSGEHPYNRLPADEAAKEKLKPARIPSLSKRQWKVLEKALAFDRKNRVESVDEFLHHMTVTIKSTYKLATVMALLLSVSITTYFLFFKEETRSFSEDEIRNELEYKIRLDLHKNTIKKLIDNPAFTSVWESDIWVEIQDVRKLLASDDEWLLPTEKTIYQAYIVAIRKAIEKGRFNQGKILLKNARRYTADNRLLDIEANNLTEAIKVEKLRKKRLVDNKTKYNSKQIKKKIVEKKKIELFELALKNVNQQIKCQGRLNMRNIDTAVKKLKSLNFPRYQRLEKGIIKSLSECIVYSGKLHPERANESKKTALRIFKNNKVIAAIKIIARDPCGSSIAGLGARGKRTLCKDEIQGFGPGPALVVVPGTKGIKSFAIGKYEVSIDELNVFCSKSSSCEKLKSTDKHLPATNMNIRIVKAYLKWLSRKSNNKYRLPTKSEWQYASKSRKIKLDPNRNCKLSTRGIQRGNTLVKHTQGKQNSWGLVNFIGNAQEWVYSKGRKLVAIGGSYEDPMVRCDITTVKPHSGKADKITGFRVLRELKRT